MSLFLIYMLVIMPTIGVAIAVIGFFGAVAGAICYALSYDKGCWWYGKRYTRYMWIFGTIWIIGLLIPTQDQMKYVVGGYVVTNVEGIQDLPKNVMGAANKFLEDFNIEDKK